ncbi:MAG TPA: hypothetical protein ENF75_07125 [Acidilobales archaeon]|nr:hypothetical protein [Acidilobales archaeon]
MLLKRKSLAMVGSLAFYLPTFGYYAVSMVWITGIGIIRALWLPLLDINPLLLKLGHVVLIPYIALSPILTYITDRITESPLFYGLPIGLQELLSSPAGLIALTSMTLGIFFFTFGTATWLYGRFKGVELIDFWAYRFCRHPQYLGFLLWSYGMALSPLWLWPPRGITLPTPTTPWLITALIVIAIALWEEARMVKEHGETYVNYRKKTPFMIPLPKGIAKLIVKPVTALLGKPYPETLREVALVIGLYGAILSIASIPIALTLR